MTRFIYKGFYYPVIGCKNIWRDKNHEMVFSRRFGGWKNAGKWWSFSLGVKVKLFNPKKLYFQFVINAINNNPLFELKKEYFNDGPGYCNKEEASGYLWNVYVRTFNNPNDLFNIHQNNKLYIGNIRTAYSLLNLIDFRTIPGSNVACCAYDPKTKTAYGWSHRATAGFKIGDMIYDETYNDEKVIPQKHGFLKCKTYEDQMMAALNYAESVG